MKTTYLGGRVEADKKAPTMKHRPAVWECMLGTVYAMNSDQEIKYFDYDWDGALEFAEVTTDSDLRLARNKRRVSYGRSLHGSDGPRLKDMVLWIKE